MKSLVLLAPVGRVDARADECRRGWSAEPPTRTMPRWTMRMDMPGWPGWIMASMDASGMGSMDMGRRIDELPDVQGDGRDVDGQRRGKRQGQGCQDDRAGRLSATARTSLRRMLSRTQCGCLVC